MKFNSIDTTIATLGHPKITSPIRRHEKDSLSRNFVHDSDRILVDVNLKSLIKLAEEGKDFKSNLNPDSLTIVDCKIEPFVKYAKVEDKFQFERQGYLLGGYGTISEAGLND